MTQNPASFILLLLLLQLLIGIHAAKCSCPQQGEALHLPPEQFEEQRMCLTPKGDGAQLTPTPASVTHQQQEEPWKKSPVAQVGKQVPAAAFQRSCVIYKVIISSSAALAHCFIKYTFVNIIISGKGKTSQDSEGSDQLFKNAPFPCTASHSLQHFQLMEGQSPATFLRHTGCSGITQRKLQSRRTLQIQILRKCCPVKNTMVRN